jgi:hypothetical protein
MSKLFILMLFLVALFATTAKADVMDRPFVRNEGEQIAWRFTELTDGSPSLHSPGWVDYSHNLYQDVPVSLPPDMIKGNWSCVRKAIRPDFEGKFICTNGQVEFSNTVNCSTGSAYQINRMTVYIPTKSVNTSSLFEVISECQR